MSQNPIVQFSHKYTQVFTVFTAFLLVLLLIIAIFAKKEPIFSKKAIMFLLISLILGPGLLVNTVFKDNFGRARPSQIKEFGGQKEFTRVFEISNNCAKNCSFACGHSSAAYWFLSFGFVVAPPLRRRVFIAALIFGTLVGVGRMVQGGHFLSDVIFSLFFVYFASKITYEIMYANR